MYLGAITGECLNIWDLYKKSFDGLVSNTWMLERYKACYILLRYMILNQAIEVYTSDDPVTWEDVLTYCLCLPENILVNLDFHPSSKTFYLFFPYIRNLYTIHILGCLQNRTKSATKHTVIIKTISVTLIVSLNIVFIIEQLNYTF